MPVPLFHCFGMVVGNLACLAHAATMVFPGEAFDPLDVMRAIEAERCTASLRRADDVHRAARPRRFAEFDLTSLRGGIMAGAPCPREMMKAVISDIHMPR